MAETIESFVAKLQAQGVQAGRQEAERIRSEAQTQAQAILAQARQQAEAILAAAKAKANGELARAQTELRLAARDAALRLRDGLNKALRTVLEQGAKSVLSDVDFLRNTIHELVVLYAQADLEGRGTININVAPDTGRKLVDWVLRELAKEARRRDGSSVDLREPLHQEGFELQVAGATLEVTLESVVNTLAELVSPGLREVLESAWREEKS